MLNNTSHMIEINSNRIRCSVCNNSFSTSDPACKHWLTTNCSKSPTPHVHSTQLQCVPIPTLQPIHLGNQLSHSSHTLFNYRGLVYCNKCGARSGKDQIRYLAKQCNPPTLAGSRTLADIQSDVLPAGLSEWPQDAVAKSHTDQKGGDLGNHPLSGHTAGNSKQNSKDT